MGIISWVKDKYGKAKDFCSEHKETIIRTGIALGSAAAGIGGAVLYNRAHAPKRIDALDPACYNDNPSTVDIDELYELSSTWKEDEYRNSWNKVEELMKNLDLKPGEEYIITGPDTYVGQPEAILSHMINGYGCYPPDPTGD